MGNVTLLHAHSLAASIRRRELSSEEVVEAYLRRIAEVNPKLNAIVTLDAERARQRAKALDDALRRGEVKGALLGVPVTVKDAFEIEGLRTTFGYRFAANYVPQRNATIVQRLLESGAIILGKTNIPEVSWDWQTNSPIFGRTNNPHDIIWYCQLP